MPTLRWHNEYKEFDLVRSRPFGYIQPKLPPARRRKGQSVRKYQQQEETKSARRTWSEHIDRCDHCNLAFDTPDPLANLCADGTEYYRLRIEEGD